MVYLLARSNDENFKTELLNLGCLQHIVSKSDFIGLNNNYVYFQLKRLFLHLFMTNRPLTSKNIFMFWNVVFGLSNPLPPITKRINIFLFPIEEVS